MFRHVLCPTDLKERAYIVLRNAVQIAHQFNSTITLLNVHPEFILFDGNGKCFGSVLTA